MTSLFKQLLLCCVIMIVCSCRDSERNLIPQSANSDNVSKSTNGDTRQLSQEFKDYWYSGKAEITSYKLSQDRYNEHREGTAVNIFVTEDFLPKEQVKANTASETTTQVLKLNSTKKFVTGIYPYSIMSSTFNPLQKNDHAIKISTSVQEWCGQVYLQLNNRKNFEITSHSYFEGEADEKQSIPQTWLENEIGNLIRINPNELPSGDVTMIPSFEYLRLVHKKVKAYPAYATLKQGDSITTYTINYSDLQRQVSFYFNSRFPYEIERWEETNATRPDDTLRLKTTAVKMKRIKVPYWKLNRSMDTIYRDSLQLK